MSDAQSVEKLNLPRQQQPVVATPEPGKAEANTRTGWRRVLFLGIAGFFFVLGVAGAILPGLPATPFLLLTSYFLVRSSPRLNAMLLRSRWIGPILADWQLRGGVRYHVRIKSVAVVVVVVALSVYFAGYSLWPTLAILSLAAVGISVILRLPSARDT